MTQTCTIPGCRIRNRHQPTCADDQCGGCLPRVADDGLACDWHVERTRERLTLIAELAGDARLVAAGLVRRGGSSGGSGKPGSRPPLNDHATDVVDAVRNALGTLARDVAETRGQRASGRAGDPIVVAARALAAQLDWIRHAVDEQGHPWCVAAFAEIGDCASQLRGLVNGPAEQKYLGPCGAELGVGPDEDCDGDVYAYPGAAEGRCRTCGTRYATAERRVWLDDEVRQHAYRPAHIADAYGIRANTIVKWHARGKLTAYWVTDAGLTVPWTDSDDEAELDARGPKVFYVGDVLDLAAADAVRRAEAESKRERRAAQEASAA